jgi:ABC-type multidrug transport system fused ATPase/permease subunit
VLSILWRNASNNENSLQILSLLSLQLSAAALTAIIQSLFPRRPNLFTPEAKAVDSEGSSSAFHRYTLQWCTDVLACAGKPISLRELPVLNFTTRSKSQPLLGLDMGKASLWNQIVHQRFFGLAKQWILMLVRSVVSFGSPYCTMKLLSSLEDSHGRTEAAWIWLVGLSVFSISQTMLNYHLVWIQWSEMGIPVRAQLIMSIFQKGLRLKDEKSQTERSSKKPGQKGASAKPEALNLISSDTLSFAKFSAVNYIIPSLFIRFFFAIMFLVQLLGWQSTLVGMTVTLACIPIHAHVVKQQRVAKKNLTAARDKKTKVINEAINALRQIKFSASENQWEEYIGTFRKREIDLVGRNFNAGNFKSAWGVAAPFIVAGASSFAYMCLHGALAPSIIFPMIELLPHLEGTLGFAPFVLQDYFGARSNASRMEYYLRKKEHKNILDGSPSGRVLFQDASVTWPSATEPDSNDDASSHRFSLHGLKLDFPVGELSIITGKTGSGKSLLLTAVLGEADILNGHIQAPSTSDGQPVAFVSQAPWLQNATIKDNILFGSPLDNERYEKVLAACSLKPDIAVLEKGDETVIGLRGLKLSGGQRARVALARAFYSSAKLLVLDDVFSALDAHVANDILEALTGEIGAGRTRILVTHQVSLCLPKAKYIVHVQNNTIDYAGDPNYIAREQGLFRAEETSSIESFKPLLSAVQKDNKIDHVEKQTKSKASHDPKAKITKKARSDLTVYLRYFAVAGGVAFTSTFVLGLIAKQLLDASTTWLLGCLNSARPKFSGFVGETASIDVNVYFYLYICSSLLAIIAESLFKMHATSGSMRASENLFREMTFRVLRMPLIWLDTTPTGTMLKRFTSDTRMVDDSVFDTISEFANCFVKLGIVISIG